MTTQSSSEKSGPLASLMQSLSKIEPNELKATFASFAFVFLLMTSYNILKPIRDSMASDWTDAEVSWLWTINFFITLAVNFIYSAALSVARLKVVVPSVYGFFALSFVAFAFGNGSFADTELVHKAYYVWVSLFALFHISVFWSFMADLFNKEQAKRLFGFIATGASVGGLVGPALATVLAAFVSNDVIMVIAALMLVPVIFLIAYLERLKGTELHNADLGGTVGKKHTIGGNPFAGFTLLLKSPFLIGISVFLFFYTSLGSFTYFELKNLLASYDSETRTQIQAGITLAINALTIVTAMFATGRIASRYGLSVTLALIPVLMMGGFATVGILASVWLVVGLQVVLKAGNYAITRPGREMLFTLVNREERFKTKPVIDTVVYRGGDVINSWSFTALTQGLGLGMGPVALVGAGVAAAWAVMGVLLGRVYSREKAAE
ncbi:MAG: NTP/NDP exchange transporter [Steroidobacteraceae bacterium]